jgi:hypothetical protein
LGTGYHLKLSHIYFPDKTTAKIIAWSDKRKSPILNTS